LLHRAKRIFLLFDSRIDGGSTGEVSRFYHQLKYLYQLDIVERKVAYDISIRTDDDIQIVKDANITAKLNLFLDASQNDMALTASSINTYIRCPLAFYLTYIEKIQPMDELSEKLEADVFGSIFHRVIARLYQPYINQTIYPEVLEAIIKDQDTIKSHVTEAFTNLFFKLPAGSTIELRGNDLLIARVIFKYIMGVLKSDKKYAPFTYISGEEKYESKLKTRYGEVNLKGYIDRVDAKEWSLSELLIIKPAADHLSSKIGQICLLTNLNSGKQADLMFYKLYFMVICINKRPNPSSITPAIIYTKHIFSQDFSPLIVYKPERKSLSCH
jgi:hypothetical protein